MNGAYRHKTLANQGKAGQVAALFPAFRQALGDLCSLTRRELLAGLPLAKWRVMPEGALPFTSPLSARQMKSAQNMTSAAVASWQGNLESRVRELVTGSALDDERKTVLYRVNARNAWWAKDLTLPWRATADGELVPCTEKEAAARPGLTLWRQVAAEDLGLARRLAKQAQKRCRYPDLRQVDTLLLDSIVAKAAPAGRATCGGQAGWWVKISTMASGRPVQIPLAVNPYFERELAKGTLCGAVQVHLTRDKHGQPARIAVSLITKTADAPARTAGTEIGIDFGMKHALFATSDGQLLGQKMLTRLRELDQVLAPYTAGLQRAGTPLKTDPYYRQLRARIKGYVTNEIGRLLNQVAARDGEAAVATLVTEKLDFRGGGMSRRMNRLISLTGRQVLQARLKALTAKHGIAVTEVPSPYTSQECSGCGYARKNNRNGARFRCRFCGLTLHADVNAARVIRSRRSRPTSDHTGPRSRGDTLRLLDTRHRQRWNLPAAGAVPDIAGAPGQQGLAALAGKRERLRFR